MLLPITASWKTAEAPSPHIRARPQPKGSETKFNPPVHCLDRGVTSGWVQSSNGYLAFFGMFASRESERFTCSFSYSSARNRLGHSSYPVSHCVNGLGLSSRMPVPLLIFAPPGSRSDSLSRKGFLSGPLSPLDSPLSVYTIQYTLELVNTFYEIFLKIFSIEKRLSKGKINHCLSQVVPCLCGRASVPPLHNHPVSNG